MQPKEVKGGVGIFSAIDKIVEENAVFTRNKVSDGKFKLLKAKNQIHFIESPDFLAAPTLYPEQYAVIRDFFELACPICNDINNINTVPREEQVLFEYNVCPKCGTKKEDIIESLSFPNTMVGVVGMRSGKSMCVAMICAAYIHEVLCIENVQLKYGLSTAQTLDGAFAAAAGSQAAETVWDQFKGVYSSSPWYQNYKNTLLNLEASVARQRGSLYWETDTSIHWIHNGIRLRAVTSNSASQAGRTRLIAIIDELSRFDSGNSKRSATEVYRALDNSLLNIRKGADNARKRGEILPDGIMVCISSPIFSEDKSMQLLKDAIKDPKMFSFHKATWEFNPTVSKEDFASLYERDPVAVERDFGAKPPGAENPFIKDQTIIDLCIDKNRKSVFDLKEEQFDKVTKKDELEIRYRFIKIVVLQSKLSSLIWYHIHCDPGETGDSFCIAIGHTDENKKIIIDGAIEAKPISKNSRYGVLPRSVHFPSMVDIVLNLASKCKFSVSYDKWNSTDQIHRLIDKGIPTIGKNLTREDHINMYYSMQNGMMSFPSPEKVSIDPDTDRNIPCATAIYQLRRLEDNGVKVDHPVNGHNDMIQCYVGVHRALYNQEFIRSKGTITKQSAYKDAMPMKIVKYRR